MNRTGAVLVETYRIDRLIGEGGMGSVYEATHVRLPKRFAVKFLNLSLLGNMEALLRFRREAEIVAALDHPHIVSLLDYNLTDDGVPYVVLEFLDGDHLGKRIEKGKLSLGEVMRILVPVAQALDFAHAREIIHRDLKPENIIIARGGEVVKVVDFGIAKIRGGLELTQNNTVLGTVPYMAPEQLMGGKIDGRCDQFALGALVFEMLTGSMAFEGDNVPAAAARVIHHQPPPIEGMSEGVNAALARALAKKMEDRFPTVEAFARAMVEAASSRPADKPAKVEPAVVVEDSLPELAGEATTITAAAPRSLLAGLPTGALLSTENTAITARPEGALLSGEATAITETAPVPEDEDDQVAEPPEPAAPRKFERSDPDLPPRAQPPAFLREMQAIPLGWEDATAQVGAAQMPIAAAPTAVGVAPSPPAPDEVTPKVMDAVAPPSPETTDKIPKVPAVGAPAVVVSPSVAVEPSIALDATLPPGHTFNDGQVEPPMKSVEVAIDVTNGTGRPAVAPEPTRSSGARKAIPEPTRASGARPSLPEGRAKPPLAADATGVIPNPTSPPGARTLPSGRTLASLREPSTKTDVKIANPRGRMLPVILLVVLVMLGAVGGVYYFTHR